MCERKRAATSLTETIARKRTGRCQGNRCDRVQRTWWKSSSTERGRNSENEWRVVVYSDVCTWHASNAFPFPFSFSLSIGDHFYRPRDPFSSPSFPRGLWSPWRISLRFICKSNRRSLRGNFDTFAKHRPGIRSTGFIFLFFFSVFIAR